MSTLVFQAVRWTAAASLTRAMLAVLQVYILARIINPADFGLFALVMVIVNAVALLSDGGLSSSIVHFQDVSRDELSSIYWLNVLIGSVLAGAVFLAAPAMAVFFNSPDLEAPVRWASGTFVIISLGQQYRSLAEKRLSFDYLAKIEVISAVAAFFATIQVALSGGGTWSLVVGLWTSCTFTTALMLIFENRENRARLHFNIKETSRFVKFGASYVGVNIANTISLQMDLVLFGKFFSSHMLGLYSQPRDMCLRIMFLINPIITRVSFPMIARSQSNVLEVKRLYLSVIRMTSSINMPIYGFIAAFSSDVVLVLLGPNWLEASSLLRVLALWCMFRALGNPLGSLLYATGRTTMALLSSITVAISLVALVLMGATFGPVGVPAALTLLYVVLVPAFWAFIIKKVCGASFLEYTAQILSPLLCTALSVSAALLSTGWISDVYLRLVGALTISGVLYLAFSALLNRQWIGAMKMLLLGRRRNAAR
ncbi:MOP flippase family protein [Devosia sp. WQ 349]|nr:MOP flippase family protein [Devosia sp. WQ 349K1]